MVKELKRLAIIGASYLQAPLIIKAKEMGYETHVFAWKANDIGERIADVFYPISIIEKDKITDVCRGLGIDGICTIASDLAAVTVNYVADKLGLPGNTMEAALRSTNKHLMRNAFEKNGDPSPKSILVCSVADLRETELSYPVIVKPLDRSGSRGITKVMSVEGLEKAIADAKDQGFDKEALVEEFATGKEYSVEYISFHGVHHFIAITGKYTTGAPHFIETGHIEPADVDSETITRIKTIVPHALDSLGITDSASHTELKIAGDGTIKIIEIGGRMGGDFIGSDLVRLSTGVDFVRAVIDVATGSQPDLRPVCEPGYAAVRFVFDLNDIEAFDRLKKEDPDVIFASQIEEITGEVTDSSTRFGYYIMRSDCRERLTPYLPADGED